MSQLGGALSSISSFVQLGPLQQTQWAAHFDIQHSLNSFFSTVRFVVASGMHALVTMSGRIYLPELLTCSSSSWNSATYNDLSMTYGEKVELDSS